MSYKADTWYTEKGAVFLLKPNGKVRFDKEKEMVVNELENAIYFSIFCSDSSLPPDPELLKSRNDFAEALAKILNQLGATEPKKAGEVMQAVAEYLRVHEIQVARIGTHLAVAIKP